MDEFNLPDTLAACADKLQDLKKQRYATQKLVDSIAREEAHLTAHIKDELAKQGATGISGFHARVSMNEKVVPTVQDWGALHEYIQKTGQFDLLQRRVSDAAVKERWQAGEKVAGVGEFTITTLSISKA